MELGQLLEAEEVLGRVLAEDPSDEAVRSVLVELRRGAVPKP